MAFPLIKQLLDHSDNTQQKKKKPLLTVIPDTHADSLVMNREEIENILYKMQRSHALLTIQIDDGRILCSSMLLEINTAEDYLVIDELFPTNINQQIMHGTPIEISCQYTGASLKFITKIIAASEQSASPYYKIPFPDVIEYSQRRQNYRVPMSINNRCKVSFTTENATAVHGYLKDISQGGFCCRLTPPIIERFKPGSYMPKCVIQLPDSKVIVCSSEIVRLFFSHNTGIPMIGCEFGYMNALDRKTLRQTIIKLERELMKKMRP